MLLLHVDCCLSNVGCCLLIVCLSVTCLLMFVGRRALFVVVCYSLCVVRCGLFVVLFAVWFVCGCFVFGVC